MSDLNDKLAALRGKYLERDDESDPNGRIYRDKVSGEIYHSVTRILGATAPEEQKKALEKWLERPDSTQTRDMAAARRTAAHNSAEYVLKQPNDWHAQQLKNATAGGRRWPLSRTKSVTKWALKGNSASACSWSASGFARGLRGWILDHVTAIHVEFSAFHPAGFAGACDALVDLDGEGPFIVDWKTTGKSIHKSNESQLHNYHQTGAPCLMLNCQTGIQGRCSQRDAQKPHRGALPRHQSRRGRLPRPYSGLLHEPPNLRGPQASFG